MCNHPEEYRDCSWCYGNGTYTEFCETFICPVCSGTGCSADCKDCDKVEED